MIDHFKSEWKPFYGNNKNVSYKTGEYALTEDELRRVLLSCNTIEEKILIMVGVATGCRRSDLVQIERRNVDLDHNTLTYIEKKKGSRSKTINFGSKLEHELRMYLNTKEMKKSKWLFPTKYKNGELNVGGHISSRTVWNIFNKVLENANISPRPVHALRATFVKQAIVKGWTMLQIAQHLGDTVDTIEKYYAVPSLGEMSEVARNKEVF
jgi:integrase